MKKVSLAVAATIAVGGLAPADAAAGVISTRDFGVFCGGNALQTCAAVNLSYDGTHVRMDVLNLSGFMGTPENTVYTKVGINGLGINNAANLEVSFDGGATWTAGSDFGWHLVPPDSEVFGAGFSVEQFASNGGGSSNPGIASTCAQTLPGSTTPDWVTPGCTDGSVDYTQAVSFRFTYSEPIGSLANANMVIRGQNVGFGEDTEGSLVCDTGSNCTPTTVVPEPITMALLGTGLAGIAGVAHRRRREEAEEETA